MSQFQTNPLIVLSIESINHVLTGVARINVIEYESSGKFVELYTGYDFATFQGICDWLFSQDNIKEKLSKK